jgi:hypothetical protein
LTAAVVFALPAYLNIGARFLIPSAPFLAMAMGIGLAELPGALVVVAIFNTLVCWPPSVGTYCIPWAWRIDKCPVRAALRLDSPDAFRLAGLSDLALKGPIEATVPKGEKIFSFAGRPESYIDRVIVVGYESTFGNLISDILWTPMAHTPTMEQHFKFLPLVTKSIRVVNMAKSSELDFWSVAEMRVRSGGRELVRSPGWKVSAWPNGWEAQLAFDNSYATRWSAWEPLSPGQRIEIEFPEPQRIDEVVLECDPQWKAALQVEVLLPTGRWVAITDTATFVKGDFPTGLRRAASRDVKALGINYLLLSEGDVGYKDMSQYAKYWGLRQLAEHNGTHFYHID